MFSGLWDEPGAFMLTGCPLTAPGPGLAPIKIKQNQTNKTKKTKISQDKWGDRWKSICDTHCYSCIRRFNESKTSQAETKLRLKVISDQQMTVKTAIYSQTVHMPESVTEATKGYLQVTWITLIILLGNLWSLSHLLLQFKYTAASKKHWNVTTTDRGCKKKKKWYM